MQPEPVIQEKTRSEVRERKPSQDESKEMEYSPNPEKFANFPLPTQGQGFNQQQTNFQYFG
jgi:hypothetical protein